jgi:hypothetical protein
LLPREVLERDVRGDVGDVGDVDRALPLQRLARISGDRDRHVLQAFRAAAGGDDQFLALRRLIFGRFIGGNGALLVRNGGAGGLLGLLRDLGQARRGGGEQGGRCAAELQSGSGVAGHLLSPVHAVVAVSATD